jgi:hypothetical protein
MPVISDRGCGTISVKKRYYSCGISTSMIINPESLITRS